MNTPSRGLGRGLTALLSAKPAALGSNANSGATLPITAIHAGPSQPRRMIHPEALEDLTASIKANGVIQPILVRPLLKDPAGNTGYEIVAGERRWQAAKLAGLTTIPVVIRPLSDQQAVAIALIENIQREELTPAEEARALNRLIHEFALTHHEVAESVGRSRAAVSNLIRLLDLPESVIALMDSKALSMGHARALLGVAEDAERIRLADLIVKRRLSVRETEHLVRRAVKGQGDEVPSPKPALSVISQVIRTPGLRAQVHQKIDGSARIVVEVGDAHVRDRVLEAIRKAARE